MVGCDSTEDPLQQGAIGDFEITITGDVAASFGGGSTFAGSTSASSSGFGIFMASTPSGHVISALKNSAGRPGTGTYQIVDATSSFESLGSNEFVATYIGTGGGNTSSAVSISGTISITKSSDNQLKGTINFTATGSVFNGTTNEQIDVTITGSFDALGGGIFQGI